MNNHVASLLSALAWALPLVVACSSASSPASAPIGASDAGNDATATSGASPDAGSGDSGIAGNGPDASLVPADGGGQNAADAGLGGGTASINGTVGGREFATAFPYGGPLAGDMFVEIANEESGQCDGNRLVLSFQTIGNEDGGWTGTWTSGDNLIVSLFVGGCNGSLGIGQGTLNIVTTSPTIAGTFSTTFDGGTLTGTFDTPPASEGPCQCDGG